MEKIRRRENRLNARLSEILERVSPAPSCLQAGAGSIMGKIIIPIILVNIEFTIIQTIIFEFEDMLCLFSMSLPKKTLELRT